MFIITSAKLFISVIRTFSGFCKLKAETSDFAESVGVSECGVGRFGYFLINLSKVLTVTIFPFPIYYIPYFSSSFLYSVTFPETRLT